MVEDVFTKWIEATPVPIADAQAVIKFLESEIFARYGYPKTIISDNARIFLGDRYTRMCRTHGIQVYYSPVYHQRSNPVERRVQELKKVLRALLFTQHRRHNWDLHLPRALHILRGRRNAATGVSPSEALLGYKLPREGEWEIPSYLEERRRRLARPTRLENIRRRQLDFNLKWYDGRQPQVTFQVGQRVMTREGAPLKGEFGEAWSGPHTVLTQLSPEVYQVVKNGVPYNIHVDDLRRAPQGNEVPHEAGLAPEWPEDREDGERQENEVNAREDREEPQPEETPQPDETPQPGPSTEPDIPRPATVEVSGRPMLSRGRRVRFVIRD